MFVLGILLLGRLASKSLLGTGIGYSLSWNSCDMNGIILVVQSGILPKTKSSHWGILPKKEHIVFQSSIFRCSASYRSITVPWTWYVPNKIPMDSRMDFNSLRVCDQTINHQWSCIFQLKEFVDCDHPSKTRSGSDRVGYFSD